MAEIILYAITEQQLIPEYLLVGGQDRLPGYIAGTLDPAIGFDGACPGRIHARFIGIWGDKL
jgi:hypothetical protein